jgi:hypothetical protein
VEQAPLIINRFCPTRPALLGSLLASSPPAAMSTSPPMPASGSISKSEFLSSLTRWRRWLARLNWHPTIDAQINAIESRQESERLRSETTLIKNETALLKNETALLKLENARLAALESKLASLLLSADSSSPIPPATDCN